MIQKTICRMSSEQSLWRRPVGSPIVYAIRMKSIREANIYPTCRLDKTSRSLYWPEDVWAKRKGLSKIHSKVEASASKAQGALKMSAMKVKLSGVTREDMRTTDRIKETTSVLMDYKKEAAAIGAAKRRVLNPRLAERIDRMGSKTREEFQERVETAILHLVSSIKKRYARLQKNLDGLGVFHPEANAQRVNSRFWADLQRKVDITAIEDQILEKMAIEEDERAAAVALVNPKKAEVIHVGRSTEDSLSSDCSGLGKTPSIDGGPKWSASPRANVVGGQEQRQTQEGEIQVQGIGRDGNTFIKKLVPPVGVDRRTEGTHHQEGGRRGEGGLRSPGYGGSRIPLLSSPSRQEARFAGIPGYDELGRVPTLEDFRRAWPQCQNPSPKRMENGEGMESGYRGERNQPMCSSPHTSLTSSITQRSCMGQEQQEDQTNIVHELAKHDEVFRHFKRYYETCERPFGVGMSPIQGVDPQVLETINRHSSEVAENRLMSKIGEGILSGICNTEGEKGSSRNKKRDTRWHSSADRGSVRKHRKEEGLPNGFWGSTRCNNEYAEQKPNAKEKVLKSESNSSTENSVNDAIRGGVTGHEKQSGKASTVPSQARRAGVGQGSTKTAALHCSSEDSLEGSLSAAELQGRLEEAWRALEMPARLKLEFLERYSNPERALLLPRATSLLEGAGMAVTLREKVISLITRAKRDHEILSVSHLFTSAEEETLCDLDCWVELTEAEVAKFRVETEDKDTSEIEKEEELEEVRDESLSVVGGPRELGAGQGLVVDMSEIERSAEGSGKLPGCPTAAASVKNRLSTWTNAGTMNCGSAVEELCEAPLQPEDVIKRAKLSPRQESELARAWLQQLLKSLDYRCAKLCHTAEEELQETVTFQGRSFAASLPEWALNASVAAFVNTAAEPDTSLL